MKKRITMMLSALLLVSLFSMPALADAQHARLGVIATNFPCYDFVRAIAGGLVDDHMLLPPGTESHSYEPTPQDIIKVQNCDVFLYVGGESDEWVDQVLETMDTTDKTILTLMGCVEPVEEEIIEGMEDGEHGHEDEDHEDADHEDEHEHEYDEHVWTSPKNVKLIAQRIADVLCEADPANADAYRQNAADYLAKLDALDAALWDVIDHAARKTIVFGDRFPFRYLADAYGLDYYAAFPGCATETEPSAKTVAFLIDVVNERRIPAVFHIELSNEKMANTICEATGAKKLLLHACHNISRDDFEAGLTYLDIMARNVEALKEALS